MKVGILVAMDKEAQGIIASLNEVRVEEYKGKTFTFGSIYGKEVVVALAGIGKVNAAYTTTLMAEKYGVDYLINTGIAGGVGKLKPLTALVVNSVCQHDSDTTALGDPIGLVSGINKVYFDADEELVSIIQKATPKAVVGRVASGDTFVADSNKANMIANTFGALACDMECGAVAQVCYLAGIKFGALKVISDSAEDGAEITYEEIALHACEVNAKAVVQILQTL